MSTQLLAQFAAALGDGGVRVVDLTQTLRPCDADHPVAAEFAPYRPFRIEEISHYDERGPGWYWNNIRCGEHTGTHFDAPCHWITGKDLADGTPTRSPRSASSRRPA